jgi:hypothetical protein
LAYEPEKPVQVNTSGLQAHVAEQVQKHADDSLKSLMEYLWFTRKIHGLWIDDVTRPRAVTIATSDPPTQLRQMATRTTGIR